MLDELEKRFRDVAPTADFCSLRFVRERAEQLRVRQDVVEPVVAGEDAGAMITVHAGGGVGYGATSDLTTAGLRRAAQHALDWAKQAAASGKTDADLPTPSRPQGEYRSQVRKPWQSLPTREKIEMLRALCAQLKTNDRIVDWETSLWHTERESLFLTADGGRVHQTIDWLLPGMSASANEKAETQTRTFGGFGSARQGGLEVLDEIGFLDAAPRVASQAVELLSAPDCPTGAMDVLLMPDQMILQVHESIGHPLELDRILGDERNYAGTSFVTPDMFGTYRYGSDLLNITFDPTRTDELASYAFDDEGWPAAKEYIIRDGILQRPLGGLASQARAGLPGVANARASSWNRPAIDRMANLNLEPGASTLDEMIGAIEHGVYMEANRSWSIDDSRNKFQFGCEYGRVIKDGKLGGVLKNCNYRGISATFWRNLKMVGDEETFQSLGTPYCGKGEPNQCVCVGHAVPACVFADVDVFGGA
ncbi:MAG: TldD/PmbA family protein [Phycisphaerales bacterium]|nr:TldD/PmbA family protein [Phycisphaerales bacterium]